MTTRARKHPRLPTPRGQNMVLLALAMLFLALMVTVTLGLGMRVRQNHELQHLADASAYSNAVMTARAFNNASLINRLEVSYFVSQSADQSLISWTAYSRGMANAAVQASRKLAATRPDNCFENNRQARRAASDFQTVRDQDFANDTRYELLDRKAGLESREIQLTIAMLRDELRPWQDSLNPKNLRKRLFDNVQTQRLSRDIVLASKVPGVQVVASPSQSTPSGVEGVNRRELDCDFGGVDSAVNNDQPPGAGLCMRGTWSRSMLDAAMGSRGSPFVTRRGVLPARMAQRINQTASRLQGVSVSMPTPNGAGYWDTYKSHGAAPGLARAAWGDDHGTLTVTVDAPGGECSGTNTQVVEAFVESTDIDDGNDKHMLEPGLGDDRDAPAIHTMASCQPLCPSVWVRTLGFQPRDSSDDAWGQPKHVAAIERDNTVQRFPWELHFRFPFSATGPAREWDGRGETLASGAAAGLNVTRSVAMATGMAYYHRREHWDEFPNLLNPFWRATLVPADVDARAGGNADTAAALADSKYRWQREAYDSLVSAGYKGLH